MDFVFVDLTPTPALLGLEMESAISSCIRVTQVRNLPGGIRDL